MRQTLALLNVKEVRLMRHIANVHEENMLFIVDEASGVAEPIMEAILGTLSGPNNKLLLCGNPTKTSGTFYDSHTNAKIASMKAQIIVQM